MIRKLAFAFALRFAFPLHVKELGIVLYSCIVELTLALGFDGGMHSIRTVSGKMVAIADIALDITTTTLLTKTTISAKCCCGPLSFGPRALSLHSQALSHVRLSSHLVVGDLQKEVLQEEFDQAVHVELLPIVDPNLHQATSQPLPSCYQSSHPSFQQES